LTEIDAVVTARSAAPAEIEPLPEDEGADEPVPVDEPEPAVVDVPLPPAAGLLPAEAQGGALHSVSCWTNGSLLLNRLNE
jgi:hypothetical protein